MIKYIKMKYRMFKLKMSVSELLDNATEITNAIIAFSKSCEGLSEKELQEKFINVIVDKIKADK